MWNDFCEHVDTIRGNRKMYLLFNEYCIDKLSHFMSFDAYLCRPMTPRVAIIEKIADWVFNSPVSFGGPRKITKRDIVLARTYEILEKNEYDKEALDIIKSDPLFSTIIDELTERFDFKPRYAPRIFCVIYEPRWYLDKTENWFCPKRLFRTFGLDKRQIVTAIEPDFLQTFVLGSWIDMKNGLFDGLINERSEAINTIYQEPKYILYRIAHKLRIYHKDYVVPVVLATRILLLYIYLRWISLLYSGSEKEFFDPAWFSDEMCMEHLQQCLAP